jgi:hypothetical protein
VLAHFLEEQGIPTACISLVRPHSEAINPPRSLWVPFEFGRPLGIPDDVAFQRRVLLNLLRLFEASEGPVLEDFPEDAPVTCDSLTVLSCPLYLDDQETDASEADPIRTRFLREIMAMRPWYDMALKKRGRTTIGGSGIDLDSLGDFLYSFVNGNGPENPRKDIDLPYTLKLAVEDLKAYYVEGITAQPGQEGVSSKAIKDWFWQETMAGQVLLDLAKICEKSPDKLMSMVGSHFIVPGDVMARNGA